MGNGARAAAQGMMMGAILCRFATNLCRSSEEQNRTPNLAQRDCASSADRYGAPQSGQCVLIPLARWRTHAIAQQRRPAMKRNKTGGPPEGEGFCWYTCCQMLSG